MALSYNLGYQESISVHPTRRQNFAGKPYSNFPNIWEWLLSKSSSCKGDDHILLRHRIGRFTLALQKNPKDTNNYQSAHPIILPSSQANQNMKFLTAFPFRQNPYKREQRAVRLEICQKIYTTGFLRQKFYTLKMCKLELILPTLKHRKFQYKLLIEMKM